MEDIAAYTIWAPTLMLVIVRVAGIFMTAPLLSDPSIPNKVKATVGIIIGLGVTGRLAAPVSLPQDWASLALGVGGEVLLGASIGFAANLLFLGIQMGAQQIGQQMGIALANVFNPLAQTTANVMGTLFHLTSLAVFLAIGGHRVMLQGLMNTFDTVPLMGFGMTPDVLDAILSLLSASFILAIKVAAPVVTALMLSSVAMGLIQRTMPQFNILSAGFQIRVMLTTIILAVSVASLVPLIENGWAFVQTQIVRMIPVSSTQSPER